MQLRRALAERLHLVRGAELGASTTPRHSERALLDAVRRCDDSAAPEIFDRFHEMVDRTIYRIRGRRGPEQDYWVEEAFQRLILTLSHHPHAEKCKLDTWASQAATRAGLNALRAQASTIDDEAPVFRRTPKAVLESRAQLAMVRQELAMMNDVQAELLVLHDLLGHSLAEIAVMLRAPLPSTESHLFSARRELRGRLDLARMLLEEGAL